MLIIARTTGVQTVVMNGKLVIVTQTVALLLQDHYNVPWSVSGLFCVRNIITQEKITENRKVLSSRRNETIDQARYS